MTKPVSEQRREHLNLFLSVDGDYDKYADARGVSRTHASKCINRLRREFPEEMKPYPPATGGRSNVLSDAVLLDTIRVYAQTNSQSQAARSLGLSRGALQQRLYAAETRGLTLNMGQNEARAAVSRSLPRKGQISRYVVTCAQSDTHLHEDTWNSLLALADYYDAEILVSTFTYVHRMEGSAKRGTNKEQDGLWYDPRIEPYVCDQMVELAPTLVWNGHMNILPTAVDPLSGMDTYNGSKSSIFPHAKLALKSIAAMIAGAHPKFQYTTGVATRRNYISKKAGQKAEFDHVYGGLLVEVEATGDWWVRQLITDSKGRIVDLDVVAYPNGSTAPVVGTSAIQWGDIHEDLLEGWMFDALWGEQGMGHQLKPRYQFMHDMLDFGRQSHHNRNKPHERFKLMVQGKTSVRQEINQLACFLANSRIDGCESIVVPSNHHEHLGRWLAETDWRADLENAEFYMDAQRDFLAAIRRGESFDPLRWAVEREGIELSHVRWLEDDEPFYICADKTDGGIAMHLHGDNGPNGARGSLRNLAKLGHKCCIGHSHSAGIYNGAWQTGVTAVLRMAYNKGSPSSWSHSHILIHLNGKRQMLTMRGPRWRAGL